MNGEKFYEKHPDEPSTDDLKKIVDLIPNLKGTVAKESAAHTLYKLSEELLRSPKRFNSIIVDHTSGHMTGVFVERILSQKYGEHIPMHMHDLSRAKIKKEPEIVREELRRKIRSGEFKEPVLVVTEAIASGRAMSFLFNELERSKIDYNFISLYEDTVAFGGKKRFSDKERVFSNTNSFAIAALSEKSPVTSRSRSAYARPDKNKKTEQDPDTYTRVCMLADELCRQMKYVIEK